MVQTHVNEESGVGGPVGRRSTRTWLLASLGMYGLCLALAPISTQSGQHVEPWGNGLFIALMGWMGLAKYPEWLANPALWSAWLLISLRRGAAGAICAAVALALGLCFLLRRKIMVDEAGHFAPIASWDAGYRFWVTSMALACVAGFWGTQRAR